MQQQQYDRFETIAAYAIHPAAFIVAPNGRDILIVDVAEKGMSDEVRALYRSGWLFGGALGIVSGEPQFELAISLENGTLVSLGMAYRQFVSSKVQAEERGHGDFPEWMTRLMQVPDPRVN